MSTQEKRPSLEPPSPSSSSFLYSRTFAIALIVLVLSITLAFSSSIKSTLLRNTPKTPNTTFTRPLMASSNGLNGNHANGTSKLQIIKRPWNARGHADHGWLYTFHTFSFASYHDPQFESFGPLRVINEDRVQRGTGFGTHSHAEFLIWSYVVAGELEHRDSMGNLEKLRRGEVQFTSAGTGIRHSEYNRNEAEDVHFLQIWAKPAVKGLKPSYKTRKFGDELKRDRLLRIMESVERHDGREDEAAPIPLHTDLSMDASILAPAKSVRHEVVADGERKIYVHNIMRDRTQPKSGGSRIRIGDVELGEGDGAFVKGAGKSNTVEVMSSGDVDAEFLLFDMGQ